MKVSKYSRPAWTPFVRDKLGPITDDLIRNHAKSFNVPFVEAKRVLEQIQTEEIYVNSLYQVNVRTMQAANGMPELKHLSIKRRDKSVVHDWRDLQRIKNELVGEECEGMEIYPAESRLVDTANQYHLWVFNDPAFRIPIGFDSGRLVRNSSTATTKQRTRTG